MTIDLRTAFGAAARPTFVGLARLHAELDWAGTHDPSAALAVPAAISAVAAEGGGWAQVIARNHALALALRDQLTTARLAPDDAFGAMVPIPLELPVGTTALALERRLVTEGWEVKLVELEGASYVRVSAHLYNSLDQAELLARKLHALGARVR